MKTKLRTPVAWLGTHVEWVILSLLVLIGAFFRFWQLTSLPPGLTVDEAQVGLAAWNLANHGWLPGFTAAGDYSPLWTWLEALPVKLLGPTELALRLWPALIGLAAVVATWIWARDWFGRRVAWIAAFIIAVTPWAVTMSRNGLPVIMMLLLVPLTLWVAGWTYHRRTTPWWLMFGGLLGIDLLAGPLGWLLVAAVCLIGLITIIRRQQLRHLGRSALWGLSILGLALAATTYLAITSAGQLRASLAAAAIIRGPLEFVTAWGHLLAMFNLRGDENFAHNFAGEPLLNAFVGLMFIAGLLAAATRLRQTRYRLILLLLLVFLTPVWISLAGAPNANHAAAALPLVALLAGIGVSYMLELWYATFPVNSAARSLGQAAIIVLLLLTLLQGYTQYFRAWAAASETYATYNEPATAAAKYLRHQRSLGAHYLVATAAERSVGAYLLAGHPTRILATADLTSLPLGTGPQHFAITSAAREEAIRTLSIKFPGGTLKPQTSVLSQNEVYYTYEVGK